jgi:hypothetical protein
MSFKDRQSAVGVTCPLPMMPQFRAGAVGAPAECVKANALLSVRVSAWL